MLIETVAAQLLLQGARRVLLRVELVEVSLVGVPMQGLARVEVVGVARRADALPSS